jgi:hypothetical protein
VGWLARSFLDVTLLGAFTLFFLTPLYLFGSYRLRRARRHGRERDYVPLADPWLPAVMALTGTVLVGLLHLIR